MSDTTPTPMTKLPDGSGFFTATIMSNEEALALPLRERPLNYRISSDLYHDIFQWVGYASMCWNPKPEGVFDSENASKAAVEICFKVANELDDLRAELAASRELCRQFKEVAKMLVERLGCGCGGDHGLCSECSKVSKKLEALNAAVQKTDADI